MIFTSQPDMKSMLLLRNLDGNSWFNRTVHSMQRILYYTEVIRLRKWKRGYWVMNRKNRIHNWRFIMIEKCSKNCKHEFQDETYGKGKRVLNPCLKENEFRCSVCGEKQFVSQIIKPKKEKK